MVGCIHSTACTKSTHSCNQKTQSTTKQINETKTIKIKHHVPSCSLQEACPYRHAPGVRGCLPRGRHLRQLDPRRPQPHGRCQADGPHCLGRDEGARHVARLYPGLCWRSGLGGRRCEEGASRHRVGVLCCVKLDGDLARLESRRINPFKVAKQWISQR